MNLARVFMLAWLNKHCACYAFFVSRCLSDKVNFCFVRQGCFYYLRVCLTVLWCCGLLAAVWTLADEWLLLFIASCCAPWRRAAMLLFLLTLLLLVVHIRLRVDLACAGAIWCLVRAPALAI